MNKLFAGNGSFDLGKKIGEFYGQGLGAIELQKFSDGEMAPYFNESVRGANVFLIQSTMAPSDNLIELCLMIDAAKRASAYKAIAVIPYFGYARQDRKDKPRIAIGAKMVANILTAAGADRIMTLDLHAGQIQGFFDIPVDHLNGSAIFVPYLRSLNLDNLLFASPDVGGVKRTRSFAQHFNAEMVVIDKHRKKANEVAEMRIIGSVEGKNVVLVDDLVDTGGTLCKAAKIIMEQGAKSVRAVCTHPVLSGKAYENINNSVLDELVVSDSIPLQGKSDKIRVLTVGELFAKAIENVTSDGSISQLFI
ncbi:ribose-phosphate pyrophosphokinase [Roseivirga sp. 4D4]|uniref:ribose-phosphate pyrophosphokinase n=1 Tax=Roseivirga sp. 4D4 TaxID=1889784 RepID=UPI0008529339|nr:ribose-phosphate pyrophosphokinase [Roseivirga sp. 4D4]OEK03722.1 ribose-phosphate pyrophosphokinase [Roseivirga sp. 4D4]